MSSSRAYVELTCLIETVVPYWSLDISTLASSSLANARANARLSVGRALMRLSDAVIGDRQRPAGLAGVVSYNDMPVGLVGGKRVLQRVDDAFDDDETEAHRLDTTDPPLTLVSSATGRVSPIIDCASVSHSFDR